MPIHHSTFFKESALAHQLLDGLENLEVGGAAHNAFGVPTLNVDRVSHTHPDFQPYASEQMRLGGAIMPVDIVAPGDCIPVDDQSFDSVISSHVIEHFYDPISAIKEWMRISRQYIFIIAPQRDALESDRDKPLTGLEEHIERFRISRAFEFTPIEVQSGLDRTPIDAAHAAISAHIASRIDRKIHTDEHHSRWTCQSFCEMCEWIFKQDFGAGWTVFATEDPDLKVGNGFCVVLKKTEV